MKEEKVIVDESLVLKFEDSTQPAKRIKQEPTDDPEESKVFVDATTQSDVFDSNLKVEIGTQTDWPIVYVCKLCNRLNSGRYRSSRSCPVGENEVYRELKMTKLFFTTVNEGDFLHSRYSILLG